MRRSNKYGAKRTTIGGETFHSIRESIRWGELKLMQRGGLISGLTRQVSYPLVVNGEKIGKYISDFDYVEKGDLISWKVVEDSKGFRTPVYRIKKKLMKAIYGIDIREIN